jgi:hypothetical protein
LKSAKIPKKRQKTGPIIPVEHRSTTLFTHPPTQKAGAPVLLFGLGNEIVKDIDE